MGLDASDTMLYISCLWKHDMHRSPISWRKFYKPLAENIMGYLVNSVDILCLVSKRKRFLLKNLISLFIMTLSDNAQSKSDINPIINLVQKTIHKIPNFILSKLLIKPIISILKTLPNVVNFDAIKQISKDGLSYEQTQNVLHYLKADSINKNDKENIRLLIKNSLPPIVSHFYTHVLSTHYTKSCSTNERKNYISYLERIFDENENNVAARYIITIAVYSINYHSDNYNTDSLLLMKKIAKIVMNKHKDSFIIDNKKKYFHIIGVAGRVFVKHENHTLFDKSNPLEFILNGLNLAKKNEEIAYYVYCCNELGLLGVMAQPHITLNVILEIYEDIILDFENNMFKIRVKEQVKESLVQCLSNIRVRYRIQVDDFLRHEIDNKDFENSVFNTSPDISLGNYFTWSSVGLFEKMHIYYPSLGGEVISIIEEAINKNTVEKGISHFISKGVDLITT